MLMRRTCSAAALAGLLAAAGGCVDPFSGSSLNVTFNSGVHTPALVPGPTTNGQPPPGTYYTFYAVQALDDDDGMRSYTYEVQRFQILPLIDINSPCFMELDDGSSPYPGIHVTRVQERLQNDTGIADPLNPPADSPEEDIIDVVSARERMNVLPLLQSQVKAVVGFSDNLPPGVHPEFPVAADCAAAAAEPGSIPPPQCGVNADEDDLNLQRLNVCRAYFEADKARCDQQNADNYAGYCDGTYIGSDKVFTLPINGRWHGSVTGSNPKNQGFLSGAQWFAPVPMDPYSFDTFSMRWQYKDLDEDGEPDYPAGTADADKSEVGFHYMEGTPIYEVTRGVIDVPIANRTFSSVAGEVAIFPSLDEDNVNF
jgi:hypothetical protein